MWANAQPDGRPAEHRWRPLFNAPKFGWRPLLDAVQYNAAKQSGEWVTQSDPWPKWPIELLTHDPCDPWPMGHRGRHPILSQLMIDKFTTDTKRTKTSICCLIVGLLQYRIDYWIVQQWRSTRVKTNEMPFLNFLLVLFMVALCNRETIYIFMLWFVYGRSM